MEMKIKRVLSLTCICLFGSLARAEVAPTVDVSLDYFGKYIWRGVVATDDPVLQPSVAIGWDKFTASVWGNYDLTSVNAETQEFTEIDYTLDYTDTIPDAEGITYSLGTIVYQFPRVNGSGNATTEIYGGLGFDTVLSPTATLYYDVDDADGFYGSVGVSHSIDISEYALMDDMVNSVDLAASLGYGSSNYNRNYWGESRDATNDFVLSVTVPVQMGEYATLRTSATYVSLPDGSIKGNTAQKGDYVYFGLGLDVSF